MIDSGGDVADLVVEIQGGPDRAVGELDRLDRGMVAVELPDQGDLGRIGQREHQIEHGRAGGVAHALRRDAGAEDEPVGAAFSDHLGDHVVAVSQGIAEDVVAQTAAEAVVPGAAFDHVVAGKTEYLVGGEVAEELIVEVRPFDVFHRREAVLVDDR